MSKCTWVECHKEVAYVEHDKYGEPWARLCREHHDLLDSVFSDENWDPSKALSYWVKAQGGAKRAVKRALSLEKKEGLT